MGPGRRLIALSVFLGAAAVPLSAQQPSEPRQIFRTAVNLVTIQASVHDTRGRTLTGLSAADFEVRDNGEPRTILSLRADRRSPVSVAILVDMSGSMGVSSKIAMARQVYDSVLSQLRDGEDEVGLFTFDSALHTRQDFTDDLKRLTDGLEEFEPFGTTSLYDATEAAARRLGARAGALKAIIVITDGIDTSSTLTAPEVSGLASSIDVPVFIVATVPSVDRRALLEAAPAAEGADLRDLAEWTGGQLVFASTLLESGTVGAMLVNQLRLQYVLAIESAGGGTWRRLDVRVRRPSAVVKARSGYFGE